MSYKQVNLPHFTYERKSPPSVIVLHYTAGNTITSAVDAMNKNNASTHYIVDTNGVIYSGVKESDRAWHAGDSSWNGIASVNNISIGIEIINFGYGFPSTENVESLSRSNTEQSTLASRVKPIDHRTETSQYCWASYPAVQMMSVMELTFDIAKRNKISLPNIVGHEHVSPGRKLDPGPAFRPLWLGLYDYFKLNNYQSVQNDNVAAVQSHCTRFGYYKGVVDSDWGKLTQAAVETAYDTYAKSYNITNTRAYMDNPVIRDKITAKDAKCLSELFKLVPGFYVQQR